MITIPSPVGGTFTVTIKDSTDTVVYGPAMQTNAPFDPAITAVGDYTMYVDNDGAIDGFCFRINGCDCPDFVGATVRKSGRAYYMDVSFDFPDGLLCMFQLVVGAAGGSGIGFVIGDLSQFTSHAGTVYTYTYLLGSSNSGHYEVAKADSTPCNQGSVSYSCDGPTPTSISLSVASGVYTLTTYYSHVGETCANATVNFLEITGGGTDSGTFIDTVSGASYNHTVHPTVIGTYISYQATITDCCGIVYGPFRSHLFSACDGPTFKPVISGDPRLAVIAVDGGVLYIVTRFNADGTTCLTASIVFIQINTGYTSGSADSGTATLTSATSDGYRAVIHPNTSFPGYTGTGSLIYHFRITTCCGIIYEGDTHI